MKKKKLWLVIVGFITILLLSFFLYPKKLPSMTGIKLKCVGYENKEGTCNGIWISDGPAGLPTKDLR